MTLALSLDLLRPARETSGMTDVEERFAELELRYISQQDLIEQLNDELVKANRTIDVLEKRVARLEQMVEGLARAVDVPANEKPPHY